MRGQHCRQRAVLVPKAPELLCWKNHKEGNEEDNCKKQDQKVEGGA